jgi:ribonuclease PH
MSLGTEGSALPTRASGRAPDDLRRVLFVRDFTEMADGSVLVEFGRTRVLCTASVEERIPPWLKGSGKGWVTAEYSMLPAATSERTQRESVKGRIGGRTHEIQRLIGRSLRGVVDTTALGERTVTVDCDVLQADGGTRTASITGGWVAVAIALKRKGLERALQGRIAAISVGIVEGTELLDLDYSEDSHAEVDFNVVGTDSGTYVEVQGTAEGKPFSRAQMDRLLGLADGGLKQLFEMQSEVVERATPRK